MPKFRIKATAVVPLFGYLEVEAESKAEALRIAKRAPDGAKRKRTEWDSRMWQQGDWIGCGNVVWEEASDLEYESVEEI